MAQGFRFVCGGCGAAIEAWDEGNPYYFDERGRKRYAYHPNPQRDLCIGNDSPHLCLSCGEQLMVDSNAPLTRCPKCASADLASTYHLSGKRCPYCKGGTFEQDPDFFLIS
jgi:DNA-directed RNA polymerase subunit RPC12/RpoP